jgi:hypothetical protein
MWRLLDDTLRTAMRRRRQDPSKRDDEYDEEGVQLVK